MLTLVALSALAGTMRSALFLLASVLSTVAAQIGASWPEAPVEKVSSITVHHAVLRGARLALPSIPAAEEAPVSPMPRHLLCGRMLT